MASQEVLQIDLMSSDNTIFAIIHVFFKKQFFVTWSWHKKIYKVAPVLISDHVTIWPTFTEVYKQVQQLIYYLIIKEIVVSNLC